jgi:hypothetical protein
MVILKHLLKRRPAIVPQPSASGGDNVQPISPREQSPCSPHSRAQTSFFTRGTVARSACVELPSQGLNTKCSSTNLASIFPNISSSLANVIADPAIAGLDSEGEKARAKVTPSRRDASRVRAFLRSRFLRLCHRVVRALWAFPFALEHTIPDAFPATNFERLRMSTRLEVATVTVNIPPDQSRYVLVS